MAQNNLRFDEDYWAKENYWSMVELLAPRYMDHRIAANGLIWGTEKTPGADIALHHFREAGVNQLLEVGSGYGRDALYFARNGINVTAVDHSALACKAATKFCLEYVNPDTGPSYQNLTEEIEPRYPIVGNGSVKIVQSDLRTWPATQSGFFDAAYSFKTLHQFRHEGATIPKHPMSSKLFINQLAQRVKPGGLIILASFSHNDHHYPRLGRKHDGRFIEKETWDFRGHRPLAFYTKESLSSLLTGLEMIKINELTFTEEHEPDGLHQHAMLLAVARKPRTETL